MKGALALLLRMRSAGVSPAGPQASRACSRAGGGDAAGPAAADGGAPEELPR